jgi:hypothetical protein
MERRFFLNEFEQSLKEHVDQFQMTPSKKVWHGIYNDLHPGKRWPSVTMSLILIFSLVFIGHLNTSHQSTYLSNTISASTNTTVKNESGSLKANLAKVIKDTDKRELYAQLNAKSNGTALSHQQIVNKADNHIGKKEPQILVENFSNTNVPESSSPAKDFTYNSTQILTTLQRAGIKKPADYNNSFSLRMQNHDEAGKQVNENDVKELTSIDNVNSHEENKTVIENKTLLTDNNKLNKNEPLTNKKDNLNPANKSKTQTARLHKKRNDKITWVYFGAPVVSSVAFDGEFLKDPTANISPAVTMSTNKNKILHSSALGFEAGIQLNYKLAKKLQFTTATHLTYSGYNITSNIVHPTFATLVLRDKSGMIYSRSFITHYGDGTGSTIVSLRNYNWQASIPVGLQYEIWVNNKLQFNLSADVEPSIVLKSNSYILSSNGNNYINDGSLLRKWNASSNFGAFVTFRSTKFKWYIGPNVRYQWLSTYQKDYPLKEHLIDYGIRIGISK